MNVDRATDILAGIIIGLVTIGALTMIVVVAIALNT